MLTISVSMVVAIVAAAATTIFFTTRKTKAIAAAVAFIFMLTIMGGLSIVAGNGLPAWMLAKPAAVVAAPTEAPNSLATEVAELEKKLRATQTIPTPNQLATKVAELEASLAATRQAPTATAIPTGMPTPVVVQAATPAPGGICQGIRMAPLPGEPHPLLVEGWAVVGVGGKVYVLSKGTYDYPSTSEGDVTFFSESCSKEQLVSEHAQPHAQRTGRTFVEGTGIFTKR